MHYSSLYAHKLSSKSCKLLQDKCYLTFPPLCPKHKAGTQIFAFPRSLWVNDPNKWGKILEAEFIRKYLKGIVRLMDG